MPRLIMLLKSVFQQPEISSLRLPVIMPLEQFDHFYFIGILTRFGNVNR